MQARGRPLIFGALCGAVIWAACAVATRPAEAAGWFSGPSPALFVVESGDSKVYIFGSYHILKANTRWMTPTLREAIYESDAFVFESPVTPEKMPEAQQYIDSEGYLPDGQTLRGLLSQDALDSYHTVLRGLPLDPREMDRLRPWLAQLTLSNAFYTRRDYSVENGADVRLMAYAMSHDKQVEYFETPRQQLEFYAEAADDYGVAFFESVVNGFRRMPDSIANSVNAWRRGEVEALSMRLHYTLEEYPPAKQVLLDGRNQSWAIQIEPMLSQGLTKFVTVGIGHLGGPGSIIEILCGKGWPVRRIPTGGDEVPSACPPP